MPRRFYAPLSSEVLCLQAQTHPTPHKMPIFLVNWPLTNMGFGGGSAHVRFAYVLAGVVHGF
jgi:hypothetical protein